MLLFGIDQALMQEQVSRVARVDPGRVHALCLRSPCVHWDSDDGWRLGMELYVRG